MLDWLLRDRVRLLVTLGTAIVLSVIAAGTILLLNQTWDTARNAAKNSLQRTASVVESTLNRQLLHVDGALASLPQLLSSALEPDVEVSAATAARLLDSVNFQSFAFRDLLLVRLNGAVWASARPRPSNKPLPVSVEELRAGSDSGSVVIAGPARNPVTGDWALFVSRSVDLPGHGPMLAVAEMSLPNVIKLFVDAADLPDLRILVERPNGQLLASLPHDESRIGRIQSPALRMLPNDGIAFDLPDLLPARAAGASTGAASAADDMAFTVTRPTLYPDVIVGLTWNTKIAMASWMRDRQRLLAVSCVAAVLILAFAIALSAALRRKARLELERGKAQMILESAIEAMADGFAVWDKNNRLMACNERFREQYSISSSLIQPGAAFEDIIRRGAELGQYPEAGSDIDGFVRRTLEWHRQNSGSLERRMPNGRWLLKTDRPMADGGVVSIRTDISALKTAQAELSAANDKVRQAMEEVQQQNSVLIEQDEALFKQNMLFNAALNNMAHGLLMVDANQTLIVCNKRFLDLFGIARSYVGFGRNINEIFGTIDGNDEMDPKIFETFAADHPADHGEEGFSVIVKGAGGRIVQIRRQPMDRGGWVATYEDVTSQQLAESRILFLAHHDDLTKLPNRVLFRARLDDLLDGLDESGRSLALLYLDLDKFKDVNDTLGHPVGDVLLEAVARRLERCVGKVGVVARLGGDEFAVAALMSDASAEAAALAKRIISGLSAPYMIAGRLVTVGASVGIAITPDRNFCADTLLKNADMSLYQAKADGRGTHCIFEAGMGERLQTRMCMESDLRIALEGRQLELAYQPLFCLDGNRISGFEALLRWNHPERGSVSPAEFVPLAEETGLITRIGEWVLRQACADASAMPGGITVAVNISPVQLRSDDIIETVFEALERSGLEPSRLELEITETALLQGDEGTFKRLHRLRDRGIRIVLDDFGTGYSSLSHLRLFPFHKIKIDKSFVREMTTRSDCAAIVRFVVSLAAELGMTTTAEGIETEDQIALVRASRCSEAQGYLLGRPAPVLSALRLLETKGLPAPAKPGRGRLRSVA